MEASGNSNLAVNRLQVRSKIAALEDELRKMPQIDPETKHYFAHGTYTRELHLPAGATVTGKIHRHSCINILLKGKIRVVTEEDDYDLQAPYVFVTSPGIKKAVHVIEDVIWLNVHPWNGSDDLEQIESKVITPSYDQLQIEVSE